MVTSPVMQTSTSINFWRKADLRWIRKKENRSIGKLKILFTMMRPGSLAIALMLPRYANPDCKVASGIRLTISTPTTLLYHNMTMA